MSSFTRLCCALLVCVGPFTAPSHAGEEKPGTTDPAPYTLYQFMGSSKALAALDKQLRADGRFKDQGCEATGKRTLRYVCKKNDGATQTLFQGGVSPEVQLNTVMGVCPTGCIMVRCPPPTGPYRCCSQTTWQPC